jgi:membrane associated rhomboid family serine protease/antitoxin component YwqK of YwqJK toxin-antitoxin module
MANRPLATYALLVANTLFFCWLAWQQQNLLLDNPEDVLAVLRAGANLNPFTLGGEPWRIVTSMFLHFGIIHFLVNMYALYSMGTMLEGATGPARFTILYFFCGVAAGMASLIFNVYVISAGASGALFGLYGYRLGAEIIGSSGNRKQLTNVLINFVIFVIINGVVTLQFNIDLAGHAGGCIAGLILAITQFKFQLLLRTNHLILSFVPLVLIFLFLPLDQVRYYEIFQRVIQTERRTNNLFTKGVSDAELLDSLKVILNDWDSIRGKLASMGRVTNPLRQDTATMRKYVEMHRRETGFRVAMIEKESYVYLDSLNYTNSLFDSLPAFQHHPNYSIPPAKEEEAATTSPSLMSRRVFYDAQWKEIDDSSLAVYYRIGQTDSLGRWQGAVRDYYRDGTVQMKGTYKDNMKHGIFLYYSDHGTYSSAGRYDKEQSIGKWETYFWNGKLKSEVYYNDGTQTRSVWDSLGRPQVVNGRGKVTEWHPNGQVAETGNYDEGRRTGDWYGYHPDGKPWFHEAYGDNRIVHGASVDEQGRRYVYDELSQYAMPVKGMAHFNEYVRANIRRTDLPEYQEGTVKVTFSVGSDGSLWDFVILEGLSTSQNEEAIRLLRDGPPWRQGLLHGHVKQPSLGYAEIPFTPSDSIN